METLARQIELEMHGEWRHCAIYERDLERLWPLNEKDREAKIAQFATQFGFRLRFYSKGMCAIFDKWPPQRGSRSFFKQRMLCCAFFDKTGNVIPHNRYARMVMH